VGNAALVFWFCVTKTTVCVTLFAVCVTRNQRFYWAGDAKDAKYAKNGLTVGALLGKKVSSFITAFFF
jgi:hypothetical protein